MSKICPAIKSTCSHFDKIIKNMCGMKTPRVSKNGRKMYCKSHTMSKEIKDLGMFSLITKGVRT